MSEPTPDQIATAIKTALNAALHDIAPVGSVQAYDYDQIPGGKYGEVKGPLPKRYIAIDLTRRYVQERRFSNEVVLPGYRLGTRYCADTISNVREMQRRVKAALENQILAGDIGPFEFETEAEEIRPDALGCTGVDDWTF